MGTAAFQAQSAFRIDGKRFLMLRKVANDLWQLEETKTKRIHEQTDHELRSLYASGKLEFEGARNDASNADPPKIGKAHTEIPKALSDAAKIRRAYAVAAMAGPATRKAIEAAAKETWEKLKQPHAIPHWTTVYRWRRKLIHAGRDIRGLVEKFAKRGNRTPRYPQEVLQIVEGAIDSVYLTPEKRTVQDVLDKAVLETRRENGLRPAGTHLPEPTRKLVTSMIQEIPAFDRCVAREGRTVALRKFRSVLGKALTDAALQQAQIDHTLMDLLVLDDDTGLPLGRPWLTVCIDVHTRCVLGIYIGFEPPSYLSVARCLKDAFLPKVDLRKTYPEIVNEWDAHGVMILVKVDGGPEFHSDALEHACYCLNIEIEYCPRKTPWFKGHIERWIGTANREVAHVAPGTTFSNIFERNEYDPAKHAVVRLSTLKKLVRMWIADVYHQRPHRTLKVPPAVMWKSSVNAEDILLPEDPALLDAILGRREQRVLTHKGIEYESLFYNSPELTALRMEVGEKLHVEICVDDGDVGRVIVLSPDKKRMFVVPALAQSYANGLTLWQHKVCKRYAAQEMGKYDSTGWLEAKDRIAQLIADEFAFKKARGKTRARAARYMTSGAAAHADRPSPAIPAVAPALSDAPAPASIPAIASTPSANAASDSLGGAALPRRFAPVIRQRVQLQS
jgi:putative transposase